MPQKSLPIAYIPPFHRVHYRALETYLARVYRLNSFNVLKAAGAVHGLYPEYLIQETVPPSLRALAIHIRTGTRTGARCNDLGLILTVLCADGHIPAGRYVIDTQREPGPLETYKTLLQRTLDPLDPECVRFKEKHRGNSRFRKKTRIIDRSLVEWLKQQRSEEP